MNSQPEALLEQNLIKQLVALGYEPITLLNEEALTANLKKQLEKHNNLTLTDNEFVQVLNHLNKGTIYERSQILRDRITYIKENNTTESLELLNQNQWCKNQFQVANQITIGGKYLNRYDVTLLINGLPLVQIELKRRGVEMKEAFHQINRYERHSYGAGYGLFRYIQLFVISNGVNTQYLCNNPIGKRDPLQCFYWTDEKNNRITNLTQFTDAFLEPCHLSKMITKYIVLNESQKALMVLRPYQYFAAEAIVERVKNQMLAPEPKYGYIWHTTGSGKTLTSFKTSQLLAGIRGVHKIIFVVDRRDLDYQTIKEFNSFSKGSIDGTNNTQTLVNQLTGNTRLIVTTIQKLNNAVQKNHYSNRLASIKNKRVVFIFDECHRSQFGETHQNIKNHFQNCQMFGFTGTPIFADNAISNFKGKRTTKELFGDCLHQYIITNAIKDQNVLKFSIEYISTFKKKDQIVDIEVEAIDVAEVMDAPARLDKVSDFIIQNHSRKTHNGKFTAMFCVSSIPTLIEYYKLFQQKKEAGEHDLRLATIFTYGTNEEDKDVASFDLDEAFDMAAEPDKSNSGRGIGKSSEIKPIYHTQHSRDMLERFMAEYNKQFSTNYTTTDSESYYNYYKDIAKRVKEQQIDLLLVVNMFLTGFDSKFLNTLYVDKNLKHHGLIQAYSRTNRINGELKSQGNIVCFRNLKKATDEAIALFSDPDAKEIIIMPAYDKLVEEFNKAFLKLMTIAPSIKKVDELVTETDELAFITAFRDIMRVHNKLKVYTEFSYDDISMNEQLFADYKSKYLDLYEKVRQDRAAEKVSILDDIDFELELIHRDEINVTYIINLITKLKDAAKDKEAKQAQAISNLLLGNKELRSKKELIEKFIKEHLPHIENSDDVADKFDEYWVKERSEALKKISDEEDLDSEKLERIIGDYLFTEKKPLPNDIINLMHKRPGLNERQTKISTITHKIIEFVETFISGIGAA
jgi:type I restriction enzyme R subunit